MLIRFIRVLLIMRSAPLLPTFSQFQKVLDRVPYTLEIGSGHRKYSSPEHKNSSSSVGGNEVFLCRIPREVFEDELLPLLELCGPVHQLRLMVDPLTGWTRGYGFCRFASRDAANRAVRRVSEAYTIQNVCQ